MGDFDPANYYMDDYSRDFTRVEVIKSRCKEAFDMAYTDIRKREETQIDWQSTKKLIFLKDTMQFIRCLDGSFIRAYSSEV